MSSCNIYMKFYKLLKMEKLAVILVKMTWRLTPELPITGLILCYGQGNGKGLKFNFFIFYYFLLLISLFLLSYFLFFFSKLLG